MLVQTQIDLYHKTENQTGGANDWDIQNITAGYIFQITDHVAIPNCRSIALRPIEQPYNDINHGLRKYISESIYWMKFTLSSTMIWFHFVCFYHWAGFIYISATMSTAMPASIPARWIHVYGVDSPYWLRPFSKYQCYRCLQLISLGPRRRELYKW